MRTRVRRKRGSEARAALAGFTLTEMMVVLVIVGLLAAVIGPKLFNRLDDARRRTALLQIANIDAAIDLYRIDMGRLPTAAEGLQSLVSAPADAVDWSGPYLAKGKVPVDPWGHAFTYEVGGDGEAYRVMSLGADGKTGGEGNARDLATNNEFVAKPAATAEAQVSESKPTMEQVQQ